VGYGLGMTRKGFFPVAKTPGKVALAGQDMEKKQIKKKKISFFFPRRKQKQPHNHEGYPLANCVVGNSGSS